jgi:hypothetical protein
METKRKKKGEVEVEIWTVKMEEKLRDMIRYNQK